MRYAFPANIEPDGDCFVVTFDGLSGVTSGKTREDALREAADLLVSCLMILVVTIGQLRLRKPRMVAPSSR